MKQEDDRDTMRPEYDFSSRARGRHHEAWRRGTNVVLLEPDVVKSTKRMRFRVGSDQRATYIGAH